MTLFQTFNTIFWGGFLVSAFYHVWMMRLGKCTGLQVFLFSLLWPVWIGGQREHLKEGFLEIVTWILIVVLIVVAIFVICIGTLFGLWEKEET